MARVDTLDQQVWQAVDAARCIYITHTIGRFPAHKIIAPQGRDIDCRRSFLRKETPATSRPKPPWSKEMYLAAPRPALQEACLYGVKDDLGILTSLPCGWLNAWLCIMSMNLQGATNKDRTFVRREKAVAGKLDAYLIITFARKALPAVDIPPIVGEWTSPNWKRESITTAPKRPT